MRRAFGFILILSLLACLVSGCSGEGSLPDPAGAETDYTAGELAAAILGSQSDPPEMYAIGWGDAEFPAYAAIYLGDDLAGRVADGVICYPFGPLASEVAVFELDSAKDAQSALEPMGKYIDARVSAFYGYAPEEAELAEGGTALAMGRFAALFILSGSASAKRALEAAFSDSAPEPLALDALVSPLHGAEPPDAGAEDAPADEYDHDAVLSALRSGSFRELTPKNRAVYDAVSDILAELRDPDMTDYQLELAVNDYLVFHAEYDPAELDSGPTGVPDPDNDNPYGLLVNGVGICLGYASTFQLMMDALDIQCVTVHGFSHGWEDEHAWNLVNLEGDWYAVDVTWNDPVFTDGEPDARTRLYYAHRYFNVTSGYLRATGHNWSEDVPEAEGSRYSYRG